MIRIIRNLLMPYPLQLTQSISQVAWNQRFLDAREKDQSALETVKTEQNQMDARVLDLKKVCLLNLAERSRQR